MIRSMTGFGRGKYQVEGVDVLVEIKTFNHRYCDFFVKVPRQISFLEDKIREVVGGYISRGKAEVYITYVERHTQGAEVVVDETLANAYMKALKNIKASFELRDDISVSLVAKFPDVVKVQTNEVDESRVWEIVRKAVEEAAKSLVSMREYEGKKLADNIKDRLKSIGGFVERIAVRAPEIPAEYSEKLRTRINEMLTQQVVDENRLAMEIAVYADKCNIDEELERLAAHISQFNELVSSREAVGRKLDFLVQEMNREINTIGSKANDLTIIKDVVDVKSEIEKIREQIQNIE